MCSTVGGEIPSDFNSLDPYYALHRINDHPISFGSQGKKNFSFISMKKY